jgi:hypothetical protein
MMAAPEASMLRFSLFTMTGAVALSAVFFGCLISASSPWAWTPVVGYYLALGLAPLGLMARFAPNRAFALGFSVWIWGYAVLTAIPNGDPQLLAKQSVDWLYPTLIDADRRGDFSEFAHFVLYHADMENGRPADDVVSKVDLSVNDAPLMEGITTVTVANPLPQPGLRLFLHASKVRQLERLVAEGKKLRVTRHRPAQSSTRNRVPIDRESFARVAKAELGLLLGLIGGLIGRATVGRFRTGTVSVS